MNIFKRKKVWATVIIILFAGLFLYNNFNASVITKKRESTKVRQGKLEQRQTISGEIAADEKVTLKFQTSGRLAWVGVKEGDYVRKYQSIASLDQRELQKTLEKELNDYLTARWDLDDAKRDTYKDKVITDPIKRIIDKYQYTLNKSVLDVELQTISKEYANLASPIEGIVTKIGSPFAGVNITPASAEFEIVNPNSVYFSATADQNEVVSLAKGMNGELILDSYPEATLSGTIRDISFVPKSGETGTVYEIKFLFVNDNADYKYRLGMAGDLTFVTKSKENVLYVPGKFIKNQNGHKYLIVKRNGKEEKATVETGMETDTDTEVISGITSGEIVYN